MESLCKANCHSVSAVTSLILLIMSSTEEYAEPNSLVKIVEGHVHLQYRMKDTKTGTIWHQCEGAHVFCDGSVRDTERILH